MLTITQLKIPLHILEGLRLELAECESDDDLGYLFETNQFAPELEEYLFAHMDRCSDDKSYLCLVKEILGVTNV